MGIHVYANALDREERQTPSSPRAQAQHPAVHMSNWQLPLHKARTHGQDLLATWIRSCACTSRQLKQKLHTPSPEDTSDAQHARAWQYIYLRPGHKNVAYIAPSKDEEQKGCLERQAAESFNI